MRLVRRWAVWSDKALTGVIICAGLLVIAGGLWQQAAWLVHRSDETAWLHLHGTGLIATADDVQHDKAADTIRVGYQDGNDRHETTVACHAGRPFGDTCPTVGDQFVIWIDPRSPGIVLTDFGDFNDGEDPTLHWLGLIGLAGLGSAIMLYGIVRVRWWWRIHRHDRLDHATDSNSRQ